MKGIELIILAGLAVLSWTDIRTRKVPVIPVMLSGVVFVIYRVWTGVTVMELAAGILPGTLLLLLAFVSGESIGKGDGLVLFMLGIYCGMAKAVAVLGMALLLAAVLALVLLLLKRANRKTKLPFLPCLCAGYLISLVW